MGFFLALARLFALKSAHSLPETHKILDSNCVLNFTWPHTLRSVHTHRHNLFSPLTRSSLCAHFPKFHRFFCFCWQSFVRTRFGPNQQKYSLSSHARAGGRFLFLSSSTDSRTRCSTIHSHTRVVCLVANYSRFSSS